MKAFDSKFQHTLDYIYWSKERAFEIVDNKALKNKIDELKKTRKLITYSTKRELFTFDTYALRKKDDILSVYYYDGQYNVLSTNTFDNTKNTEKESDRSGQRAICTVNKYFKAISKTTFKTAFGYTEEKFKRCIPKQIIFTNKSYMNRKLNFSSIDIASSFPAGMCGRLPDAHTAVGLPGLHKPTKEYPFAFYINSGHIAECGDDGELVYDTHEWLKKEYAINLFRITKDNKPTKLNPWPQLVVLKPEDEYTVLMKASDYELTQVYEHFYNIKETYNQDTQAYKDAKGVMNKSIGFFHTKSYDRFKLAHLAAVAIARADKRLIDYIDKVGYDNIAQVQVDSLIYIGKALAGNTKKLGEFTQEFEYCTGKISKLSNYIFMQDDKIVKAKWQGNNFDTQNNCEIKLENIHSLDDQYNWVRRDPLEEYK